MTSKTLIVLGLIFGTILGVLMRYKVTIKADKINQHIWIPGSYTSLIVFLIIFAAHFLVGYVERVAPGFLTQGGITEFSLMFLLTAASGLTVGANLCLYAKYYLAENAVLAVS